MRRTRAGLRLGQWVAYPEANELVHASGRVVRLEARTMDVLALLHERAGEVVSVEEFLSAIWQGRAVSDHSVAIAVSDLRQALGDEARSPRYVETVPKRGYRLIASTKTPTGRWSYLSRPGIAAAAAGGALALLVVGAVVAPRIASPRPEAPASARAVSDPEELESLFLARQLWSRRSDDAVLEAVDRLRGVLASHPDSAPAHALLAMIYAHKTGEHLGMPALDTFRQSQRHLDEARRLQPALADVHLAEALLEFYRDHQPRKAWRTVERAVEADPRSALAWQTRAMVASALGRHEESLPAIDRAAELDPVSESISWDRVWFLYLAGRAGEARAALEELEREAGRNFLYEALVARELGEERTALELWLRRVDAKGFALQDPEAIRDLAEESLLAAYGELLRQTGTIEGYHDYPGVFALWHLDAGAADAALETLAAAPPTRDHWMVLWLDQIPAFAPLRERPEMRELLARTGLGG